MPRRRTRAGSLCGVTLTKRENVELRWHGRTLNFGVIYTHGRPGESDYLVGHFHGWEGQSARACILRAKANATLDDCAPAAAGGAR